MGFLKYLNREFSEYKKREFWLINVNFLPGFCFKIGMYRHGK